jgi:hypothetical protein
VGLRCRDTVRAHPPVAVGPIPGSDAQQYERLVAGAFESIERAGGHGDAIVVDEHESLGLTVVIGGLPLKHHKHMVFVGMGVQRIFATAGVALDHDAEILGLGQVRV